MFRYYRIGDDVSRIMFGMRSKIKELVKLVKVNSNSKSQLKSDDYFQN